VEFGLMDPLCSVDNGVARADMRPLTLIYRKIIDRYFA
jgi:hypothetical protein